MHINDPEQWRFVNGAWREEDGGIAVPEEVRINNEASPYRHFYAFNRNLSYKDLRVRFEFMLHAHSEAGIVLRASNESHFYVLHFPNCGQACRAQHFWVAFSKMDDTGYLKHIKLEMVRRVPSNGGMWLSADLTLEGNKICVRIGDTGYFEAEDDTYTTPGHIGLFSQGNAKFRNIVIEGEPAAPVWKDGIRQPVNWFNPIPVEKYGKSQMPADLIRMPSGELLLNYSVSEETCHGKMTHLLTRSSDDGRTWSASELLKAVEEIPNPHGQRIHLTPAGRLIAVLQAEEEFLMSESADEGRTWSKPAPMGIDIPPPKMKSLGIGPQAFVNLADGSIILLTLGGHSLADSDLCVYNWGGLHCSAFTSRSTDDGRTWSPLVSVDNSAGLGVKEQTGNLDLTEVCAAQMGDGRIIALIRPVYSPWMWETWSTDGGATWGPCARGPFPGYATPNMLRTSSGRVLITHRLPSMTVNCSSDDGITWDEGTQIESEIWVMGSMVEVKPDLVLYLYMTQDLMRGQYIRITPEGLKPVRV